MAIAKYDRVRVTKVGDKFYNFIGSVTAVYLNGTADVILDSGLDRQSGGETPPGTAKNYSISNSEIVPT